MGTHCKNAYIFVGICIKFLIICHNWSFSNPPIIKMRETLSGYNKTLIYNNFIRYLLIYLFKIYITSLNIQSRQIHSREWYFFIFEQMVCDFFGYKLIQHFYRSWKKSSTYFVNDMSLLTIYTWSLFRHCYTQVS